MQKPTLDYDTPERRRRFVVGWGGWVLLVVVVFALAAEWAVGRHPAPGPHPPYKVTSVQLPVPALKP